MRRWRSREVKGPGGPGTRPEGAESGWARGVCAVRCRFVDEKQAWIGEFAHRGMGLPPQETPGLEATVFFRQDHPSWSFGAGLAVVRVVRDTGQVRLERFIAVDDCGTAINPLLIEGQIVGGFAQGLGQALLERIAYGEDGQLLTGTFMDYAIPRADDMPELVVDRTVTLSPSTRWA